MEKFSSNHLSVWSKHSNAILKVQILAITLLTVQHSTENLGSLAINLCSTIQTTQQIFKFLILITEQCSFKHLSRFYNTKLKNKITLTDWRNHLLRCRHPSCLPKHVHLHLHLNQSNLKTGRESYIANVALLWYHVLVTSG